MNYKVIEKVVATGEIEKYGLERTFTFESPNFIAYKVTVGLYIFYITSAVYEQGVRVGIIEPISEEVPEVSYTEMRCRRGMVVNHRMSYALKLSTLEYLQQELKRANEDLKIVTVKTFEVTWYKGKTRLKEPVLAYLEEIKVDLLNRVVLYNNSKVPAFDNKSSIFYKILTYDAFLDRLAYELDREFMNSRNLFDKFRDVGFYEVDNWQQRLYKFEFTFE